MTHTTHSERTRILLGAIRIFVAFAFVLLGSMKLLGTEMMIATFAHVGVGQWLRYFTGSIEVMLGILVLSSRLAGPAASVLVLVCLAAVASHLTVVPGPPYPALLLLVLSGTIAWCRRSGMLTMIRRSFGREAAA